MWWPSVHFSLVSLKVSGRESPEVLEKPGQNSEVIAKVHKERILVYFASSQQLFVLRCLPN
jgi:hypothetical protein